MLKQYRVRNYHFQLILYVAALTIMGIFIIGSAQKSVQNKQLIGFLFGMVIMIFISLMDYSFILKFSWLMYFGMIVLLALVHLVGVTVGGAQRWIPLPGFNFQPSEVAKIIIILFFSKYFMKYSETVNTVKTMGIAFIIISFPLILILKQPDTSTTLMIAFIFIVLLFISGLSYKIVMSVIGVSLPVAILFISYVIKNADALYRDHYQFRRILSWIDPMKYSDDSLQQRNAIMAIGSGQLWGKGLNNSEATSMKNAKYIIEPQTDFYFAVAGEELGFVGTFMIILLLFLIVLECILIARKAKDLSGQLICCGMASLISLQALINICVATGLMPNTGIPLPFVSYGLTSLVSLFIGMGFVLNVGLQPKKY